MIYTCTLNPSVDYVVKVDELFIGNLNRTKQTDFYAGGKGINVSRVLKNLGVESTALGYVGGFTGRFIKDELNKDGVRNDFIEISEPTRINIKLKCDKETEINGLGAYITSDNEEALLEKIKLLTSEDCLVLAGSLPPSVSPDFYEKIAQVTLQKKVQFIADTSGGALEKILKYEPFLVKPNEHELGELFQTTISNREEALQYGKRLLKKGPKNVIVSLGSKGALFINEKISAFANVPKGELKNSVGAGDSVVAGFLASYVLQGDFLEAFKYGIACGSATAFSTDLCEKSSVEKLLSEIQIETLKEEEK